MLVCKDCGYILNKSAKFCIRCGSRNLFISDEEKSTFLQSGYNEESLTKDNAEHTDSIGNNIATSAGISRTSADSFSHAQQTFRKPDQYNKNTRKIIEDGQKLKNIKSEAFENGPVKDPYTGNELLLTKQEARMKYGDSYQEHLANVDHVNSVKSVYDKTVKNPFLSTEDQKVIANLDDNLVLTSQKFNYGKKHNSNTELVKDPNKLSKTGLEGNESQKKKLLDDQKQATKAQNKEIIKRTAKGVGKTFNEAGLNAAESSVQYTLVYDVIRYSADFFSGDINARDALISISKDAAKSVATAYLVGGGLTTTLQAISAANSPLVKKLVENNVPSKIVTGVLLYGNSVMRLCKGELTVGQFAEEAVGIGVRQLSMQVGGTVGSILIPIPVVGEVIGSMVATAVTDSIVCKIRDEIKNEKMAHEERMYIISECNKMTGEMRSYRIKLQNHLQCYFNDLQYLIEHSMVDIKDGFLTGNPNQIISGANAITTRMGGTVRYKDMNEFRSYLADSNTDTL